MKRALVVLVAAWGGVALAKPPTLPVAAEVRSIAAEYVDGTFGMFPEQSRQAGVTEPRYDALLTDLSPASLARWHRREDTWLERLRAIDARALEGRPEWATYRITREQLETSVAKRVCREELWGVRQMWGWQEDLSLAAAAQPVGTPEARARLLKRWRAIPRLLATEIANLREGLRLGYSAPKRNVQLVVGQVDGILKAPHASFLLEPVGRDPDPALKRALGDLVARTIVPAVRRYRDFLVAEYLPRARETVAIAAHPRGAECYAAYLREGNGMPLSARDVHRLGQEQVQALLREVARLGSRSFGTDQPTAVFARVRTEPRYLYKDREAMIACARGAVARARTFLPRLFGRLPRADVEVRPTPPERDDGTVMMYRPAPEPGRPGTFWISTAKASHESASSCETIAWHETVPGHHLQMTLALEGGPALSPIAKHFWSNGFGEGWALYAERLMLEQGAFTSDLQRVGFYSEQALRAARLVVDTGLHALGWSRERAIRYMLEHTALSPASAGNEVDRYVIYPGQATGYMIGMLTILKLRDDARRTLGPRFDLRAFNDRVLELGNVPLPVMDAHVRRWLAPR